MNLTPNTFAKQIAKELLKIKCPPVEADVSVLRGTSIAALVNGTLYYNPTSSELDICFSLAHELRHVWQLENNKSFYFGDYKTTAELSIKDYNNQIAELDANAFGYLVMKAMFGVEAQFTGLDQQTKNKILERVKILIAEFTEN